MFENDKPIYLQVEEEVKTKILSGKLKPGDKLESVREMASRLQVNPNTIQRAFLELEREGFIVTKRAVGRFVLDNREFIENTKKEKIDEIINEFFNRMKEYGLEKEDVMKYLEEVNHELD